MLSIARALLINPKLLILDLAPLITREVFRAVAKMRGEGISVLLVEQNVRMSLEIADGAYVLDDGRIVYSGPARELAADTVRVQSLAGASVENWVRRSSLQSSVARLDYLSCLPAGPSGESDYRQGFWTNWRVRLKASVPTAFR
jgi:ABC-type multidrug transport system ATPase subunit